MNFSTPKRMLVKEETGRIDSTEALRLIKIEFEKSNTKIMLVKKI